MPIPLLLAVIGLFSLGVEAQTPKQVDVGGRATALGGAFSALADDASAVHWNSAGLAALQRTELYLTYAERFGLLDDAYLSYVLPLGDNHALGFDWFQEGFDDVSRRQDIPLGLKSTFSKFALAYGYRNGIQALQPFLGNTSIGFSGKYISHDIDEDGTTVMSASGWGWDAGVLVPLPFGLRAALAVQDVGGTSVEHKSGVSEEIFPDHYRLGLAYKPLDGLVFAAELDDHYRLGGEYWLGGLVALRAGVKSERDTPLSRGDATTPTFGVGVKHRFLQLDYSYQDHPELGVTHYGGLALSYNPRVVTIKSATIRPVPVFRSLYKHYEENDFFDVVLRNSAPEEIAATVSLMLPKLMSAPHQEEVLLPPQSTQKYTFKVTFDADLFNQSQAYFDQYVTPTATVTYRRNRRDVKYEKPMERVYVAGKGKLSWNKTGMAATFVTPTDLAVAGMARGLVQRYDDLLAAKFNRSNIGKAALVFDAMGVYRIGYLADPKTPFASISDDRTIFDTVQYPSELLAKGTGEHTKVGDCDDLTVLYASLLENLSIDTVFLEANVPGSGHIYLMFDSGIRPDRAEDHFIDSSEYVEWEGRIWIPVETTMFGFPFANAWRRGTDEYKRLKPRQLIDEVPVGQYMQVYKPAALPAVQTALPEPAALDSLLGKDIRFFDQRIDKIARGAAVSVDTPDGLYNAGAAYLRVGHLERALEMFDLALAQEPNHGDALNGKGVARTRQGRYEEALFLYREALKGETNNGIRMNIALTYYLMGERETADRLYEEVVALNDSYGELFDFMARVGDAQAFYEAGSGYLRQLQLDKAVEQFDLALDADPQYADAINGKGVVRTRQSRYQEALALFEAAAVLAPDQPGFRLNGALVHYLMGDRDEAAVVYRQVVAQNQAYEGLYDFITYTETPEELYQIAVSYLNQGLLAKALEQLEKVLAADPGMSEAYNAQGVVRTRQGDYEQAYALFGRAAEMMPANPGVLVNMAIVRYVQGRKYEAKVLYQQAKALTEGYDGFLSELE
ncbi:MAG: tetratricopeptide repeat protein [Candidatus Latescibacteria bacterium]|nr:tetratricopeptide repeat protein [Candidatus Latescibacterota bacterium]